jgi:hypothetical protein
MTRTLVQVTCSGPRPFCAGLILEEEICISAAPILRRHAMGKTTEELRVYFKARGWRAVRIGVDPLLRRGDIGLPASERHGG